MSSERAKLSHEERTSQEPRQHGLHLVNVAKIEQVNPDIRLFKLGVQDRENGLKVNHADWIFDIVINPFSCQLLSFLNGSLLYSVLHQDISQSRPYGAFMLHDIPNGKAPSPPSI